MINECCEPIFWIDPAQLNKLESPPLDDPNTCAGDNCYCGYIQFENLIPYLAEIQSVSKDSTSKGTEFEFKLRQQIIETSRLFDIEAGVKPGYFTQAHYSTTKLVFANGTRYLKISDFVPDTLEVRTINNFLLDPSAYVYKDGYLIYHPCLTHTNRKRCSSGCGGRRCDRPIHWPAACYQITARWGQSCTDPVVQKAVREYIIESYRVLDPIESMTTGIPITRTFKVPYSWSTYITNFKQKRHLFSQFQIA